ncbi:hypothetical protein ES705_10543 [subsurface metagenome]
MGSGSRARRVAYGQLKGESMAIQEHQLAMLPITQKKAEMELELREKMFVQELEQTKQMNLLALQLQPEPIFMPAEVAETKPVTKNYLIYAALAALAFFLLRKK